MQYSATLLVLVPVLVRVLVLVLMATPFLDGVCVQGTRFWALSRVATIWVGIQKMFQSQNNK